MDLSEKRLFAKIPSGLLFKTLRAKSRSLRRSLAETSLISWQVSCRVQQPPSAAGESKNSTSLSIKIFSICLAFSEVRPLNARSGFLFVHSRHFE